MASIKLVSSGGHAAWAPGEIVTVQVVDVDEDGSYNCETLDTYPPDLKERHAAELVARDQAHIAQVAILTHEIVKLTPEEPETAVN